jgi:hypothetical protein
MIGNYHKQYVDLGFERSGLFELIREKYNPQEVLYPGCSVHITPSLFFPHVVYIDQDPAAKAFFSNRESLLDLINRKRRYHRTPHIQFIFQDFTQPLPILENQFDLILALYTGGVSKACKSYLKVGGLILTNNHHSDAIEAAQDSELTLIANGQKRKDKYRLIDTEPGENIKIDKRMGQSKRYLRQTSTGVEYIENERYYIFKRSRL